MTALRLTLILLLALPALTLASDAENDDGTLSPAVLRDLRKSFKMDADTRVRYNAITNNSINDLALNRDVVRGQDGHFSHKIEFKGITNQKASGRCWLFAGLNTMRPRVIREKNLPSFEFSTAYLQFWDKMEKSNLFLETMIEMRETDYLDREWELVHKWTMSDGGWWNFVVDLIEKYGVVPKDVMPETQSSDNTRAMNTVLDRKLRADAVKIRRMHEAGATVKELRAFKRQSLREVYRFLVMNLGEPPTEFEWRYVAKKKDGEDEKEDADQKNDATDAKVSPTRSVGDSGPLSPRERVRVRACSPSSDDPASATAGKTSPHPSPLPGGEGAKALARDANKSPALVEDLTPAIRYTPKQFYEQFVGVPLRDYVCLYSDPVSPFARHYRFKRSKNIYGSADMHFVNLRIVMLKTIAMKSVVANEPVWFAADVGKDQSSDLGIMAHKLYDYDPLFGFDTQMSKAERIKFRDGASNHAMVFMGVDVRDGKPGKWLVENSWGDKRGDGGTWTLYDKWFDEHVYTIIVNKRHVPQEVLDVFDTEPTVLPPWYPGAPGVRNSVNAPGVFDLR